MNDCFKQLIICSYFSFILNMGVCKYLFVCVAERAITCVLHDSVLFVVSCAARSPADLQLSFIHLLIKQLKTKKAPR